MASDALERTETLAEEIIVAFRRRGANRVHFALVMPESLLAARYMGCDVTLMRGGTSAFCARTLRGDLFVIPQDKLDSWKRNGHICRECRFVAMLAYEKASRRAS